MNLIFEEVISTFIFGKDILKKKQTMIKLKLDGTNTEEK